MIEYLLKGWPWALVALMNGGFAIYHAWCLNRAKTDRELYLSLVGVGLSVLAYFLSAQQWIDAS